MGTSRQETSPHSITTTPPLVSVVIVNWNGLAETKICLEHTRKQSYKSTEIIVVDNGSHDDSLTFFKQQADIKLVKNSTNLGFTGGHIAGYHATKGAYVLLMNNDAVMDIDYIARAVKIMEGDETIGALGGRAYLWDAKNALFDTSNDFYAYQNINPVTGEGIFTKQDLGVLQTVNNVSGSCVMVRRSTINQVGYLHDPFFAYYEESDLFARMKRAGYKIVYSPDLAIWHANGVSSRRKAPTFMYYMMMRNRFRFAVRNFDTGSLRQFLKFYLRMGVTSFIRSIIPNQQLLMRRAYSKAFLYNLLFGWRAFTERRLLIKSLGKSTYNQKIASEQLGISIIAYCETKSDIDVFLRVAETLPPLSELILTVRNESIVDYAKSHCSIADSASSVRLCIDRGYFQTHSLNLGALSAKNDWLILASTPSGQLADIVSFLHEAVYSLVQQQNRIAVLTPPTTTDPQIDITFSAALELECAEAILLHKSLFVDAGGVSISEPLQDGTRALLAYGVISHSLKIIARNYPKSLNLDKFSEHTLNEGELHSMLSFRFNESKESMATTTTWGRLMNRYYRLAQLTNLLHWIFSTKIKLRLKVARLRNILVATMHLNQKVLAIELKHIRNELVRESSGGVDLVKRKLEEGNRLEHLASHPGETIVFIIARDRFSPLQELLAWLESQGLRKIVIVDNDSALPTLTDYINQTDYQVIETGRNCRHTVVWTSGIIKILLPDDFYIVTDPDVIPCSATPVLPRLYHIHKRYPHHLKVGLGLKIDDLPDHYGLKQSVVEWESQFTKYPLEDGVYEAGVDTTFALYKPYTYSYFIHPSLRTGEPFTARHLPWYADDTKLTNEDVFYRLRADQSVNTWNKEQLPDRYVKELAKQRH